MGANSKIEWTHHTFNPWRGCTKVSAGCAHCYADTWSKRNPKALGIWGKDGTRVIAAESYWQQPIVWNREAAAAGERRRVFCASLADVFEGPESMPADSVWPVRRARWRLLKLIHDTPNLDWLLLTKRPENFGEEIVQSSRTVGGDDYSQDEYIFWATDWAIGKRVPENVWIGASIEDQPAADKRIPELLKCPAGVRFLSVEPMVGAVDLSKYLTLNSSPGPDHQFSDREGHAGRLHWVIVGGESGAGARSFDVAWARSIIRQCKGAGVACFVKQLGANPIDEICACGDYRYQHQGDGSCGVCCTSHAPYDGCERFRGTGETGTIFQTNKKGGNPDEWPEDLRVREFPKVEARHP